jgi:hypothetical protein
MSAENLNKRGMTPDTTLQFCNSFILMSLPPSIASALWLTDQGVTDTSKSCCTRKVYRRAIQTVDAGAFDNLKKLGRAIYFCVCACVCLYVGSR